MDGIAETDMSMCPGVRSIIPDGIKRTGGFGVGGGNM